MAIGAVHWQGIAFMLAGTALFTCNDALGKWMVASLSVGQILFVRSVSALVILLPLVWRAGAREVFVVAQPGRHAVRLLLIVAEVSCFYLAVRHLPLADVMAVYQATPLIVTVLAIPLLGERVGWRRGLAVGIGFCGVMLVLQPAAGVFSAPALIALAGSLGYALMMITTRRLRAAGALSLIVYHTLAVGLAGLVALPWGWQPLDAQAVLLLALMGVVATGAHMCVNQALKLAPAATVVPYTYTSLLWAILLGWVFFADRPTLAMLAGAGIIVASGLFVLHRERQIQNQ
jgi:drug/metabolite transporter (DMT)-like permease